MANTKNHAANANANTENNGRTMTPPPSAYSWASASHVSTNILDHAADHGQYAECSTSSTATTVEG
jgi:hypothetical protein